MTTLKTVREVDVHTRCSEASFARGEAYYRSGAVLQRIRNEKGIEAHVAGSSIYRVIVREGGGEIYAFCTCPYDWGGDCKHIVATLLAWLHEPESFRAVSDLHVALAALDKEDLVTLLTDICGTYPHLVDEFNLLGDATTFNPAAVVGKIFGALDPRYDEIDVSEGVARMENIARQAARFAQQGHGDLARRTYYELIDGCVSFCEAFGAHDIFPAHLPEDFAEAYHDLALEQVDEHAETIQREVSEILKEEWAPEILGVDQWFYDVLAEFEE